MEIKKILTPDDLRLDSKKYTFAKLEFLRDMNLKERGVACADVLSQLRKAHEFLNVVGSTVHMNELDERGKPLWNETDLLNCRFMLIYYVNDPTFKTSAGHLPKF